MLCYADTDHEPDYGYPPPPDDAPNEPTLRELVVGALCDADFRAVRAWPSGRGTLPNEVMVSPVLDREGYEVCVIQWEGPSKGSAVARHQGAFDAARAALAPLGLYAVHEGGLRLEVGWKGTPEGPWERWAAARAVTQ